MLQRMDKERRRGSGTRMIKKIILGIIRILGYVLTFIIFTFALVFIFTFGVIWLGETSGGFAP